MAIEAATYISDLNASNPLGLDQRATLDDHIRLVKSTVKATFPNVSGAVTKTHTQINAAAASGANTDITSLDGHPVGQMIAQVQSLQTGTVATGTATIPFDNTIPQITEGDQYMSLAITPTNASSTLEIDVVWMGSNSVGQHIIAALFKVGTAGALAASAVFQSTSTGQTSIVIRHRVAAGSTSAMTFTVRAGGSGASTTTFNGQGGAGIFGGVMASSITIRELLP